MRYLAIAALMPTAALAHGGPAGHAHPHGLEGLALAAAALAIGWLIYRIAR